MSAVMVRRAIVPAAGHGTRLRPLTRAIPKEMLPLGRRPVLEYVLAELRDAGILDILVVVSPGKEMIQTYLGDGSEFGVSCTYAVQRTMRGLGDAILQGEAWVNGEPFAVAFGDCIVDSPRPADQSPLGRMLRTHAASDADATVLTEYVDQEATTRYGMLVPAMAIPQPAQQAFRVAGLVEKPALGTAPSRQAVAARWILRPSVFGRLRAGTPGANGEVGLTECIGSWTSDGARVWAEPLLTDEARIDVGGWRSYLVATARAAARDPEFGLHVRASLG